MQVMLKKTIVMEGGGVVKTNFMGVVKKALPAEGARTWCSTGTETSSAVGEFQDHPPGGGQEDQLYERGQEGHTS